MLNKKKGFTLIELLVAIAIIGILAGLLVTGITKARQKALQARAIQSFNQIALAMQLYYDKNNVWPTTLSQLVPEFYPSTDASWYCSTCAFYIGAWDKNYDGKPDCGYVQILNPTYNPYMYIYRYALCITDACGSTCGSGSSYP